MPRGCEGGKRHVLFRMPPAKRKAAIGHLEQCSILTPDWAQVRVGSCFRLSSPLAFSAHCFGWNTADDSTVFMPRRAVPASPGGECCRLGSASRSWRAPARCRSFARSDRPARSAALRRHARCEYHKLASVFFIHASLEPSGCRASKAVHGNKPPLLRKFDLLHWLS